MYNDHRNARETDQPYGVSRLHPSAAGVAAGVTIHRRNRITHSAPFEYCYQNTKLSGTTYVAREKQSPQHSYTSGARSSPGADPDPNGRPHISGFGECRHGHGT